MADKVKLTKSVVNQITNYPAASAGSIIDICNSSVYDARIYSIVIFSDDTSNRDCIIYINDGTSRQIATVSIPLNSGNTNAVAAFPLHSSSMLAGAFNQKDNAGVAFYHLKAGQKIQISIATITAAKQFNIFVNGALYD